MQLFLGTSENFQIYRF